MMEQILGAVDVVGADSLTCQVITAVNYRTPRQHSDQEEIALSHDNWFFEHAPACPQSSGWAVYLEGIGTGPRYASGTQRGPRRGPGCR